VEDLDSGEQRRFTIVGAEESNTEIGFISYQSPLGRSLIGCSIGEVAKVQAPSGEREYEILEVLFVDWDQKVLELGEG
jgi:transcription elongation factor GreA